MSGMWTSLMTGGDRLLDDDDGDNNSSAGNNEGSSKKREVEDDKEEETSSLKKARVNWSVEMHQQFVAAVNHLGVDKAFPKKILEMMNVPWLTRANVASHLQKYRIYLRRLGGVSQHQGNMNNSFMSSQDLSFAPLNGFDLQSLGLAGQLPAQSLSQLQAAGLGQPSSSLITPGMSVDQSSIFSFVNSKSRFGDGHVQMMMNNGGGNNQMSLLHGVPTGHMHLQQQPMGGIHAGQNVQSSGMSVRSNVPETRSSRVLPATTHSVFNNSFPLASGPRMSVSDTKGGSFGNASYDIFNDFPQQQQHSNNRLNEWDLRNMGMVFSSHQDTAAAFSTSEAYSSSSSQKRKREAELMAEHGQIQSPSVNQMNQIYMNGGSVRVKTETGTCPQATTMFHEQYDQEDLMSALLKQEGFPSVDNEFDFEGYSFDNILV